MFKMETKVSTQHKSQHDAKLPVVRSLPSTEEIRTPIQDALYATGKFTTDDCDLLSDGILQYLNDAGLKVVWQ